MLEAPAAAVYHAHSHKEEGEAPAAALIASAAPMMIKEEGEAPAAAVYHAHSHKEEDEAPAVAVHHAEHKYEATPSLALPAGELKETASPTQPAATSPSSAKLMMPQHSAALAQHAELHAEQLDEFSTHGISEHHHVAAAHSPSHAFGTGHVQAAHDTLERKAAATPEKLDELAAHGISEHHHVAAAHSPSHAFGTGHVQAAHDTPERKATATAHSPALVASPGPKAAAAAAAVAAKGAESERDTAVCSDLHTLHFSHITDDAKKIGLAIERKPVHEPSPHRTAPAVSKAAHPVEQLHHAKAVPSSSTTHAPAPSHHSAHPVGVTATHAQVVAVTSAAAAKPRTASVAAAGPGSSAGAKGAPTKVTVSSSPGGHGAAAAKGGAAKSGAKAPAK